MRLAILTLTLAILCAGKATTLFAQAAPMIVAQPKGRATVAGSTVSLEVVASDNATLVFGAASAMTNIIDARTTVGTVFIDYEFFMFPDEMRIYHQGILLTNTGLISGIGRFAVPFGPGTSTLLEIVMNEATSAHDATAWIYTAYFPTEGLHYQWRKDTMDLPGTDTALLQLTNIQPAQSGGYSVIVSNTSGSVTSIVASVLVLAALPTLTITPINTNYAIISWPIEFTGYQLQYSHYLDRFDWTPFNSPDNPDQNSHRVRAEFSFPPRRFFRLVLP